MVPRAQRNQRGTPTTPVTGKAIAYNTVGTVEYRVNRAPQVSPSLAVDYPQLG